MVSVVEVPCIDRCSIVSVYILCIDRCSWSVYTYLVLTDVHGQCILYTYLVLTGVHGQCIHILY